jgi:hypothetical protein
MLCSASMTHATQLIRDAIAVKRKHGGIFEISYVQQQLYSSTSIDSYRLLWARLATQARITRGRAISPCGRRAWGLGARGGLVRWLVSYIFGFKW